MGLKLCSCLQGGVVELKLCDLKLMAILDPKATRGGREEGKGGLYGEFCVTASPLPLPYVTLAAQVSVNTVSIFMRLLAVPSTLPHY